MFGDLELVSQKNNCNYFWLHVLLQVNYKPISTLYCSNYMFKISAAERPVHKQHQQIVSNVQCLVDRMNSYLRFTQALLGGSPKNWTWHSSFRSYSPRVGWSQIKLGHQGCPSSFAHNIPQSSIFGAELDSTFDCFGEFLSFLVAAFSPLIGEKPFAPSFGELFLFFSAVSPHTGEEGFLDFGVKYEKRVAIFISLRSTHSRPHSREQFSRVSSANVMRMCNLFFNSFLDSLGHVLWDCVRKGRWFIAEHHTHRWKKRKLNPWIDFLLVFIASGIYIAHWHIWWQRSPRWQLITHHENNPVQPSIVSIMVNWHVSKQCIHWPTSCDHIAGLKVFTSRAHI